MDSGLWGEEVALVGGVSGVEGVGSGGDMLGGIDLRVG